jgi:Na+/proline symporter
MTFAVGVFISFLVYIAIGVYVGRRVQNQTDYFVAGRGAPALLITGSLVASYLSTVGFMGEVGFAYSGYALPLLTMAAFNASGYVLGVIFFGRYLRRSESLTIPEFFGKRFNSGALQALTGVTVIIGLGAYLIAVTQGLSLIMADLLTIDRWLALLILWVAYTSFTLFAGSPGVLWTDTLMFLIFGTAAVIGMSYLVVEAGGPAAVLSSLSAVEGKEGIVYWWGQTGPNAEFGTPAAGIFWGVLFGIVWGTVVATSPWQSSRYLMARTEHTCLRAGFAAMIGILVMYMFLALGGAAVNIFNPNIQPTELAFVWAAQNVLPIWLGVLAVTGIVAAGLSSASTFLSLVGFSTAHDIAPIFRWARERESSAALGFSRAVMLVVGLIVLGVTIVAPPAVFEIGYFAATLFVSSWGPLAFLSVYNRRLTRRGAIAGMSVSFGTVFVLQALITFTGFPEPPIYLHPVIIGFAAGLVAFWVGSLGHQPDEESLSFQRSLFEKPPEELDPARTKSTFRYAYVTFGACIVVIVFLFLVYYLPFSQTIAAGP